MGSIWGIGGIEGIVAGLKNSMFAQNYSQEMSTEIFWRL